MSFCPGCGHKQVCPCIACVAGRKKTSFLKSSRQFKDYEREVTKPWVWMKRGELIKCGLCGFTQAASWWEGLEVLIYEDRKRKTIQ